MDAARKVAERLEIHDVGARDDGDPSDTRTHAEVLRLLAVADNVLGRERPTGSVQRHEPLSPELRRQRETRALAGGRPQRY